MNITIIDYGMGNLRSVQKKFQKIGSNIVISNDPVFISRADKLVLPGVGHFENGVKNLKEFDIWDLLNELVVIKKIPILGICLGMQLMTRQSEEGGVKGFGWFDAEVAKFSINDTLKYKVPHMGWNTAEKNKESLLLKDIPNEALFYYLHSYHVKCNNFDDILTTTEYEYHFTSSIEKNNIFGTQFHPEKSHYWGESLLKNFIDL